MNESAGPGYIFEFKYRRDVCNSNPETARKAKNELYDTARTQVLKYAEPGDKLRTAQICNYVLLR